MCLLGTLFSVHRDIPHWQACHGPVTVPIWQIILKGRDQQTEIRQVGACTIQCAKCLSFPPQINPNTEAVWEWTIRFTGSQLGRRVEVCKHQFIWIFIVVDPGVNILQGFCQFGFHFDTMGSPEAENRGRYKPAWRQLDAVRNHSQHQAGQFFVTFHTFLQIYWKITDGFIKVEVREVRCFCLRLQFWHKTHTQTKEVVKNIWRRRSEDREGRQHWDHGIP